MKKVSLVLTIFLLICFVQTTITQENFRLGFVKDADFNGDSIWLANTKKKDRVDSKVVAVLGYDSLGKININGNDIELKLTGGDLPDENFVVGKGGYQAWEGENITVRLDYIFTWLCPQDQENCSVYYYKGVFDINYNGKRKKIDIVGFGGS